MTDEERRSMSGRRETDLWNIWDRRIRDLGIYIVALAGVINQVFFNKEPSEIVLVFLAAMLGFPLVLRADELRRIAEQTKDRDRASSERGKR